MKIKKCKGINRAKAFEGCGKESPFRRFGLCPSCLSDWMSDTEDGKVFLHKQLLWKVQKPRKDFEKAEKEHKESKSLSYELEKTKTLFNKYIRLRDEGKNCITEDIPWQKDFEAGHCYSVKQYSALRFDFDNVHGQSILGNRFKGGNEQQYLMNLPNRIGKERTEALKKRAELSKKYVKKWTRHELQEIRNEVKLLLKGLKN